MSSTYVGIYVMLLAALCKFLGLDLSNDQLTSFVEVALLLVGSVVAAVGRYRLGGVTMLGARKSSRR